MFKSMNGGGSWSDLSDGLFASEVTSLAIDPMRRTILYAGTKGGGVFDIQQMYLKCRIYLPLIQHDQ